MLKIMFQRRNLFRRIFLFFIVIFFLLIVCQWIILQNYGGSLNSTEEINSSSTSVEIEYPPIKIHHDSIYYLYIDVGCFNGETIEHFLYFTPNSSIYNIITFEPDPNNYRLCRSTLSQTKYSHLNIFILRQIVWIRDEKLAFRTGFESKSRIDFSHSRFSQSEFYDAIDFSSWLNELTRLKKTKIHMKISTPGSEVLLLDKMAADDTISLADSYQIEWTDRQNPKYRGRRIYIQLLFDTLGYDSLFYTRLEDVRETFSKNQPWNNVTKIQDWRLIDESDAFAHYAQRPDKK